MLPVHNRIVHPFLTHDLSCLILLVLVFGVAQALISCKSKPNLAKGDEPTQAETVVYVELPEPDPNDTTYRRFKLEHRDSIIRLLYRRCNGNLSVVYDRFAAIYSALPTPLTPAEYLDTLVDLYSRRIAQSDIQCTRLRPLVREGLLRTMSSKDRLTDTLSPYHAYYHIRRALHADPNTPAEDVDALYLSLVTDAFLVDDPIEGYLAYCLNDFVNSPFNMMYDDDCSILEVWTSDIFAQMLFERAALMGPPGYQD